MNNPKNGRSKDNNRILEKELFQLLGEKSRKQFSP
jgi:hypothetical protein